jgi:hypothetical protein
LEYVALPATPVDPMSPSDHPDGSAWAFVQTSWPDKTRNKAKALKMNFDP